MTGGQATFLKYADQPLAALDRATRAYYVLGYYPTRAVAPEEVRRIDVSVRPPNVTLQYRARPAYLRAVLYDYETDRLASTQVRLKPR